MNRKLLALALVAACLPGLAAAEKVTVYKSTGANGETVYSQLQVSGSEAVRVNAGSPEALEAEAGAPEQTPMQKACDIAKTNLAALDSGQPVQFDRDGDGKLEVMSAEEMSQNRENTERQVRAYCEPAPETK